MIKTIILDCDGVLTDGTVTYHEDGTRSKTFNSRDIYVIKRLVKTGFNVWIITRSQWPGITNFAKRAGCRVAFGVEDKLSFVKKNICTSGEPYIAVVDDYEDLELAKNAEYVLLPENCSNKLIQGLVNQKNVIQVDASKREATTLEVLEVYLEKVIQNENHLHASGN